MARPRSASDEEILDAADKVMSLRGLEGFSVSEVGREIGLSRAAITFRFDSVDALKLATLERRIIWFEQEVARWSLEPGARGLLDIATKVGGMVGNRAGLGRFLTRYSEHIDDPAARHMEVRRGEVLRGAVASCMPPVSVSQEQAVDAYMANLTGSLISWRASGQEDAGTYLRARTAVWLRLTGIAAGGDEN